MHYTGQIMKITFAYHLYIQFKASILNNRGTESLDAILHSLMSPIVVHVTSLLALWVKRNPIS